MSTLRRSARLLAKRSKQLSSSTVAQPSTKRLKRAEGCSCNDSPASQMALNLLDLTSGDIVSIALEEKDLGQTVSWLIPRIEDELKKMVEVSDGKALRLRKLVVGKASVLLYVKTSIEYYLLDGEPWIIDHCVEESRLDTDKHFESKRAGTGRCVPGKRINIVPGNVDTNEKIEVTVAASSGSARFRVGKFYCLSSLMQAACDHLHYNLSTVRFLFGGCVLDPYNTVEHYGMISGDRIDMYRKQTGGGPPGDVIEFADISKGSALKRKTWSESAPQWRVARPGLCIEGVCTNRYCNAYGEYVIVNKGYGDFDLESDSLECSCSVCGCIVEPATCAFNNCRWKWVGKKVEPSSASPVVVRGEWKEADDAYHRFDEKKSGKAKWLMLKITTESLDVNDMSKMCVICLWYVYRGSNCTTLPCNHSYHSECITKWMSRNATCPLCRAAASMTALMKKAAGLEP